MPLCFSDMKKLTIFFLLIILNSYLFSQSNNILLHQDTVLLKATECNWIVSSLSKNDPVLKSETSKSVPLIILQAIEKGKLKAIDPFTNKIIPAKEIFTWQMPRDTMMAADADGNFTKLKVIQQRVNIDNITQLRVLQNWYLDVVTGKIQSEIKWIELILEVHNSMGIFIGLRPFCRVYY